MVRRTSDPSRTGAPVAFVNIVIAIHIALLALSAYWQSPTYDEPAHLVAGLRHWQSGRFDVYRANPPLVRLVAAAPLLFLPVHIDWSSYVDAPGIQAEFQVGRDFVQLNGEKAFWYIRVARWACIPFSVLGAYICWKWASELYGEYGGAVAVMLWSFCPNILANGSMITPDCAASSFGITAAFVFRKWLYESTWQHTVAAGCLLGLAQLTKMTWIVLFVIWPLQWIVWRFVFRRPINRKETISEVLKLTALLVLGIAVLNAGYGFSDCFYRLKDFRFSSSTLSGVQRSQEENPHGNRFVDSSLSNLRIPLPRDYVLGIDTTKRVFELRRPSYLRGEFRDGGWWYYYLYGLAVKLPLGTWLLIGLAGIYAIRRRSCPAAEEFLLFVPACLILVFVSTGTGINRHLRYVLPVFPFIFVLLGHLGCALERWEPRFSIPVLAAVAWSIASSLWVYPHSLSYFNELVGGPRGGHAHLICSNIDWGQDLFYLKRWLDKHAEARPLGLAFYGSFDPTVAGIKYQLPPKAPVPGWFAVSVHLLRGNPSSAPDGEGGWRVVELGEFSYFLHFEPVAMAGYSIYIYHVSSDDANRVREKLGLPVLNWR